MKEQTKENLVSLIAGFIFGAGLIVSGMTRPDRVIGFLDIMGNWNPSLAFVMGGALMVHIWAYQWIKGRERPLVAPYWHIPRKVKVTKALLLGAFFFGVGWGLIGLCPGPALVSLASGKSQIFVFVLFMLLGQALFYWLDKKYPIHR